MNSVIFNESFVQQQKNTEKVFFFANNIRKKVIIRYYNPQTMDKVSTFSEKVGIFYHLLYTNVTHEQDF